LKEVLEAFIVIILCPYYIQQDMGGSPESVGWDMWDFGHDIVLSFGPYDHYIECTGGDPDFVGSVHRYFNKNWE
jgi:hypothetical protein